jgi:nucleoside-specific outer membrane channel protein Tsx
MTISPGNGARWGITSQPGSPRVRMRLPGPGSVRHAIPLLQKFITTAEPSLHARAEVIVGTLIAFLNHCGTQLCARRHDARQADLGADKKGQEMTLRHLLFAAALAVTATQANAQGFSDTSIGLRDSMFVANPGAPSKIARDVNKVILNVGHFDVWDYGSNFFNVDALFSDKNESANNLDGTTGNGSTEFYAVYRGQLSPDKIFGINTAIGPFSAINFEFGGDWESENNTFGADKKLLIVGPNFHVALPKGFLTIGIHFSKEWSHNAICANTCAPFGGARGGAVNFDPAAEFELVWLYPLDFTGLPLDFRGFANFITPKGKDGFGNQTTYEILARPQLQLDIGKMLYNKSHKPDIYLAVELWQNKFGNNHKNVSGTQEVAPTFGIEYHF